jgi:hypothetical protein
MLEMIAVVVTLIVAIVGLIVQIGLAGIYIGKLEGFKTLVEYKLDKQDEKLEKHNNFIVRVYELEKRDSVKEEQIKVQNNRIKDLEKVMS